MPKLKPRTKADRKNPLAWMPHTEVFDDVITFVQTTFGCLRDQAAKRANAERVKFHNGGHSAIVYVTYPFDGWKGWKGREVAARNNKGGAKGETLRDKLRKELGVSLATPDQLQTVLEKLLPGNRREKYEQAVHRGIIKSWEICGFKFWMLWNTVPPLTLAKVQCLPVYDRTMELLKVYGTQIDGLEHKTANQEYEREHSAVLNRILELNGVTDKTKVSGMMPFPWKKLMVRKRWQSH
jgi:hypothetical protein